MKFTLKIAFFFTLIGLSAKAQYIDVNDTYSAQQLVEDILINSPCANVSNFSVSGWDAHKSYGYFSRGTSDFPFQEGVLITTGRAVSAIGPNDFLLSEGGNDWLGDPDLEQAIGENNTINATVLEFDFLPIANKITFEYIFSSEQYYAYNNPSQCNYSDGFAFLLREAGGQSQYQNLAVVPNTSIPVKITTIRGEGTICPASYPQYFDAFNGVEHPTNYNGQTKILKAEANVTPGTLYHMKLVIADQGNELYDSAIFLGGGSFTVETDLGPDRLIATGNPVCEGETFLLNAAQSGENTYQWYRNGVLIPGAENAVFEVMQEGTYRVEIFLGNSGCTTSGEIIIEYIASVPGDNAVLFQCVENNSGISVFDLFDAIPQIVGNNSTLQVESFHQTISDAQAGASPILNPHNYSTTNNTAVYARVSDTFGCASVSEVRLRRTNNFLDAITITACSRYNNPEVADFNLIQASNQIYDLYGNDLGISYHISLNYALLGIQNLPINFANTQNGGQTIYARLENATGCFGIIPVHLRVVTSPQIADDITKLLCLNNGNEALTLSSGLTGSTSGYGFLWSTGETTPEIQVNTPGIYYVQVSRNQTVNGQLYTCYSTREITVNVSQIAEADYILSQNQGRQTITITTSGSGNYVYALNNEEGPYQESPVFENVPAGVHTAYIMDTNGCGTTSIRVYVLGFPNFFTPNNDGYNDYWQVIGWEDGNIRLKEVFIFDRFGKIVHNLDFNSNGWDGTYRGKPLPSNDYWFKAVFSDGGSHRGHFTMKR